MKHFIYLCIIALGMSACNNDDYLKDGGVADPHVNKTTYDYLASNPLFSMFVKAVDKAGLKEVVNGNVTLYVPTDYCFESYFVKKRKELQDQGAMNPGFGLDDIPVQILKDSLKMYVFNGTLNRDNLIKEGKVAASLLGMEIKLSKEPVDQYTDILTDKPEYLFYIGKVGQEFDSFDDYTDNNVADDEKDSRVRVQTSGLISTTGTIHILDNAHILFFYGQKVK